jgi:hypothetical protein
MKLEQYIDYQFDSNLYNFIKKNIIHFNLELLSNNPILPIEIINIFPNLSWNFKKLSKHPKLIISFVIQYNTKKWDWFMLSNHPNIEIEDILTNIKLPWIWSEISRNKNINWDIINNYPNIDWDKSSLIRNPNLYNKLQFFDNSELYYSSYHDYLDSLHDLNLLCGILPNKYINQPHILDELYPYVFTWDIPNLDFSLLEISSFDFNRDKIILKKQYYINKIQNWWLEILSNPYHPIGHKYQLKKFNNSVRILS